MNKKSEKKGEVKYAGEAHRLYECWRLEQADAFDIPEWWDASLHTRTTWNKVWTQAKAHCARQMIKLAETFLDG